MERITDIELLNRELELSRAMTVRLLDTIAELNGTVKEMSQTISDLKETVASLEEKLVEKDGAVSKAKSELRSLKATALPKKSEKREMAVKERTEEELEAERQRRAEERKERGNNGARRSSHAEIEMVTEITDIYPDGYDAATWSHIGEREVVRYKMIPPKFLKEIYRIHTARFGELVASGKSPLSPIQNSSYDGSFIAGLANLRYLYSMPVERIVPLFREGGFDLKKSTAHGLLGKTADICGKLYAALGAAVKEDDYLCCDETYHTVLQDPLLNGGRGSMKGYVWSMVSPRKRLTYFFYDKGSRRQEIIRKALEGYTGTIQSDGLKAYKNVERESGGRITRLGCLQHCKRPFADDDLKGNPDAERVLYLANTLYRKEHRHRVGEKGWTAEDNRKWRSRYAPPRLRALKRKLKEIASDLDRYPEKSTMHRAATYFLNEMPWIENIFKGGDFNLDNNLIERNHRYISISRRNSLFFGSHGGAECGCVFYSLACSCRMNGISFFKYLSDVLNRMAAMPDGAPVDAYRDLLPDRWKPAEQTS